MDAQVHLPWGLTRMTDRLPESPPPYATAVLDPVTQTAVFRDGQGLRVDMGAHGTNKAGGTSTKSGGGGDGKNPPGPQVTDDSMTDYVPD